MAGGGCSRDPATRSLCDGNCAQAGRLLIATAESIFNLDTRGEGSLESWVDGSVGQLVADSETVAYVAYRSDDDGRRPRPAAPAPTSHSASAALSTAR